MRLRTFAAVAVVGALAAVGAWVGTAGADRDRPAKIVSEKGISKPGEKTKYAVWRNGKYHYVQVTTKRVIRVDERGQRSEAVLEDASTAAEMNAQLPPVDPNIDQTTKPTPQQEAESNAFLGIDETVFPAHVGPGHSQGTIPASPNDPPRGP